MFEKYHPQVGCGWRESADWLVIIKILHKHLRIQVHETKIACTQISGYTLQEEI